MELIDQVKKKIKEAFSGADVNVQDTSAGHEGHNPSGAHLSIEITYAGFAGKTILEQHRMINDILREELQERIHALQIKTKVE